MSPLGAKPDHRQGMADYLFRRTRPIASLFSHSAGERFDDRAIDTGKKR
jgi:hypothetical protein